MWRKSLNPGGVDARRTRVIQFALKANDNNISSERPKQAAGVRSQESGGRRQESERGGRGRRQAVNGRAACKVKG